MCVFVLTDSDSQWIEWKLRSVADYNSQRYYDHLAKPITMKTETRLSYAWVTSENSATHSLTL